MSVRNLSPLRYPGGKACLAASLQAIIYANGLQGCTYVEPFAGGAGAGLKLLVDGHVSRVVINDADRSVYCFWHSVMNRTDDLIHHILKTPISIDEWQKQREIYRNPGRRSHIEIGFAAFYLNRCNRSGIIKNGGPIGGMSQNGKWKLDARFNRQVLAERIREISTYGDRIMVLRRDALDLLGGLHSEVGRDRCFIYADPPYYKKGRELYLSHYDDADHKTLAEKLQTEVTDAWVVTYDDVPRIRELYKKSQCLSFGLRYSAHEASQSGAEVLIAPDYVRLPCNTIAALGNNGRVVAPAA